MPRLTTLAPIIYLCTALPVVVVLSFLTPPFQVPDEGSHFRRAVHILGGGIVGKRLSDKLAGGAISAPAIDIDLPALPLLGHPERKIDPATVARMREVQWSEARRFQFFASSAVYPPVFYLPAVAGLLLGKVAGLGLVDSATFGRLLNALAVVALGGIAIAVARRGRALLFVILSLPLSLFLAAGITQDGLLAASTAMAAALVSRGADQERELSLGERAAASILMGLVAAARPPCAPLLVLLLCRTVRGSRPFGLGPFLGAAAIAAGWIAWGIAPVIVPFRPDAGVSAPEQLAYLLQHPGAALRVAFETLSTYGSRHFREFIGILGWGDTELPFPAYWLASVALATAVAIGWCERGPGLPRGDAALVIAGVVLSSASIYGALYLGWTPVGASLVEGVQGRYFLPVAGAAAIALPALFRPRTSILAVRAATAGWALLFVLAFANSWIVPATIHARFYG